MTGTACQARCGSAADSASGPWLSAQLRRRNPDYSSVHIGAPRHVDGTAGTSLSTAPLLAMTSR